LIASAADAAIPAAIKVRTVPASRTIAHFPKPMRLSSRRTGTSALHRLAIIPHFLRHENDVYPPLRETLLCRKEPVSVSRLADAFRQIQPREFL